MAQGTVKQVELPNLLEGCAWQELIAIAGSGEWKTAGRKAVVVVVLQAVPRKRLVGNAQPPRVFRIWI
jgi:hypothetical protein